MSRVQHTPIVPAHKMAASRRQNLQSLLCFLQGLQTYKTIIELRNEITIEGTIEHVDDKMKWVLINVITLIIIIIISTTISGAVYKLLNVSKCYLTLIYNT